MVIHETHIEYEVNLKDSVCVLMLVSHSVLLLHNVLWCIQNRTKNTNACINNTSSASGTRKLFKTLS